MRTDIRAVAIALIGYLIITSFVSVIMVFIAGVIMHGIVYACASFVGLGFIWFCFKSDFYLGDILYVRRAIPRKVFANALICAIGIQPIFLLANRGVEFAFESAGYKITFGTAIAQGQGLPFLLLNSILLAPLNAEILFRGIALRIFSRYGRNFAMLTSAIMFALYSASFPQIIQSFALGLLLAYITFRYSIKWAAVLHCSHNLVWSLARLIPLPWYFACAFLGIFLVWGIVIAVRKFAKVRRFADKGRSIRNAYKYFFTAPAILIYIAIAIALACMEITVVPLSQIGAATAPTTILV
jgi:hypothetical protein